MEKSFHNLDTSRSVEMHGLMDLQGESEQEKNCRTKNRLRFRLKLE